MKIKIQYLLLMIAIVAGLGTGCSPDNITPSGVNNLEVGAGLTGDTSIHQPPTPKCGTDLFTPLVFDYQGQEIPIGQAELVNGLDFMHILYYPQQGLSVAEAAVWRGDHSTVCGASQTPNCIPPVDAFGVTDPSQFPYYNIVNPVLSPYSIRIPLSTLYELNSFSVWSLLVALDQNGLPIFSQAVWAKGKPINQNGGQLIDYALTACPGQICEPWIDGTPPCNCVVPTPKPTADLSEWDCGIDAIDGSKKVNVCHLPPGYPENMQMICISVNALPAHIIDFKPLDNPCLGHHSGCHIGPCDPCGPGSSVAESQAAAFAFFTENGCTGSAYGGGIDTTGIDTSGIFLDTLGGSGGFGTGFTWP